MGNHDDPERIVFFFFCLELERKWQETEMLKPSPSFLVTTICKKETINESQSLEKEVVVENQ